MASISVDPLSKVIVKSQSATIQKDRLDTSMICLQYRDDVHVTFADSSTVSADSLEIFVKKNEAKKIVFKSNVCMNRNNQKVRADVVKLFVEEKRCELRGHVLVEQMKEQENDVPLKTKCEHARLKWDSEEIELVGSEIHPVSTTIEFGGTLRVLRKNKKKKKA